MLGKELRQCLHDGSKVYGTHVTYMSNYTSIGKMLEIGLDYVFLCGEHMTLDQIERAALCRFFSSNGVAPVVRVSHPSTSEVSKALDAGAHGIVVPYVETVQQVRDMVGAVRYRPLKGQKLEELLDAGGPQTLEMIKFFEKFNSDTFLIIGIESEPAYDRLDELLAVPGVDGVFIGPHDMTTSIGHPEQYQHPKYQKIVLNTIRKCRAANIGIGVHVQPKVYPSDYMLQLMELGMNWILDGADITFVIEGMKRRRKELGFEQLQASRNLVSSAPMTCVG